MSEILKTKINWYPGHMKKTLDLTKQKIKSFNIFLFVLDARCPISSIHPDLQELLKNKIVIYVVTKIDLADPQITNQWVQYFNKHYPKQHLFVNLKQKSVWPKLKKLIHLQIEKKPSNLFFIFNRIMVVGVPNTGKSTLINNLTKRKATRVENKPGLTKSLQTIKLDEYNEICDTPGLLWPKFTNEEQGINLAIINAIKKEILPIDEVLEKIFSFFSQNYQTIFFNLFGIKNCLNLSYEAWIETIAQNKNFYLKQTMIDMNAIFYYVLKILQDAQKIKYSLEKP